MVNADSVFLIKELQKGNKSAFEMVFKKYYSPLCVFVSRYCTDDSMAEEIVSGFFYNFYQKRESLEITTSIRSYLFRAVKNSALNYIRDHAMLVSVDEQESKELILRTTDTVHDTLMGKEMEEVINKAIDNLPEQCKIVFVKSRFEGKKYREIAEELNISVNTVETQMSRALKKLRVELKDYMSIFITLL